jgi:signal transduction histidine kinase/ligand-binding sensor domain-containing protein
MLLAWGECARSAAADVLPNRSWCVRTWAVENGLASNWVSGIAQTPDGFLWVSTHEGLSRFDGVRFENRSLSELPGLKSPLVRVLQASRAGGLWLGLHEGQIVYYDPAKAPRVFADGLPNRQPDSLVEDPSGALWVGYHNGPVCRLADGVAKMFDVDQGVRRGPTASLAVDMVGQVWLARSARLSKAQGDRFVEVTTFASGRGQIAPASDGGLWVCSAGRVFKFTESGGMKELGALPVQGVAADRIVPFQDSGGTLWIGTSGGGLFRHAGGANFEKVITPQANILRMTEDRAGNQWVATVFGFDRITPRAVALEGTEEGLPFGSVNALSQAEDGSIWAVTGDAKLVVRAGERWKPAPIALPDSPPVSTVLCAPEETVWIGTKTGKVMRAARGVVRVFGPAEGIDAHAVSVLMRSRRGDLWIGAMSPDGLFCLRDDRLVPVKLPAAAGRVRAIVEDDSGGIWIGCASGGSGTLLKADGPERVEQKSPGGMRAVRCLATTSDGSLWIGCDGGLGRLKDDRLVLISEKHALHEDGVSQIIPDQRGWMWLGGDHGISRVRKEQLDDVADGRIAQLQSFHYGSDEDVPPLQAKSGQWPCALRTADGRLWMPMGTALAVVDPQRVRRQTEPPPVYIERVARDDRNIAHYHAASHPDRLELPPDYHHLDLTFTAPAFNAPEGVRFRYRLEGFDEDWTEVTELRRAMYPRLPAGKYRFRVTACNADGIWSPQGATLAIVVVPFFWQTWWFTALALVAFGAVMILLARYVSLRRLRQRLEILERRSALDRERARIAKDIHDDLGHDLTQIALLSDLTAQNAEQPPLGEELQVHLRQIASTAKQGMRSLDETVWAINPRNDTLADLIDYVGQFVVESLRAAEIRCHLNLPDHPPQRTIPSEARHHLFLAVKEAINNVLRHAHASEVTLGITLSGDAMTIQIGDNGRGFVVGATPESTQDGVRNMNQRMIDVGGSFSVCSSPGQGTRVTLSYPWRRIARSAELSATGERAQV